MILYHNSRSADCRSPFGAVPCGAHLCLRVFTDSPADDAKAVLHFNGAARRLPMRPLDENSYEVRFTAPDTPGLLWYYFRVTDEHDQPWYLGNAPDGLGGEGAMSASEPASFQITVYSAEWMPPAYMREGIMYQIFPDRFCRSKPPFAAHPRVYLHKKWDEDPLATFDPRNRDCHASDFFGGDLPGITQKLDYLQALHVTVLYLNPIFMARSNHRYDTGDYSQVDPLLGTEEDLRELCREAEKRGIRILLDGVFNHTGDDSLYFNRLGRYPSVGAYQSKHSPYYSWYKFTAWPRQYKSWWGFGNLPELDKENEDYRHFLLGRDGIVRRWMRCGIAGWRLDVADELSMRLIRDIRISAQAEKADAILLGEVWEDASCKTTYGETRCYCTGDTLDSVMNYPLRAAAIAFVKGEWDAYTFIRHAEALRENYPTAFLYSLMNMMGSHDRPRILNMLCGQTHEDTDPLYRGACRLTPRERALAVLRLREMWKIYAAMPGVPCVYYGDEAGVEGGADPFCRRPYPWGQEDAEIMALTRDALALRASRPVLQRGACELTAPDAHTLRIRRFSHSGYDVFGQPLEDADYEILVRGGLTLDE